MLQILMISLSISFVSCQTNCPDFLNYKNDGNLLKELNGDYMVVYTSSEYVLGCERISWTVGPDNSRTANLIDANDCCRRIDNFDSSNPDYYLHDITPLNNCTHLHSTEKVGQKLLATTGTGMDQCLIVYVCHPSRNGLLVKCRQQPDWLLWITIVQILGSVLNLVVPTSYMKMVNQYNCIFDNTCFI